MFKVGSTKISDRAKTPQHRELKRHQDLGLEARRAAREVEMRGTLLGSVLDRVDAWNRKMEWEREESLIQPSSLNLD